jgi:geranylgeranyl diphosphate synthase type II
MDDSISTILAKYNAYVNSLVDSLNIDYRLNIIYNTYMLADMKQESLDQINAELERIFTEELKKARGIHPSYARLWEAIRTIALAGGKRLRPRLLLQIAGSNEDAVIKVAVAHELLHIATLIHDDIIDNDEIRHGKKNLIGLYKDIYADANGVDIGHYARSMALLGGDLLLSHAHRLIAESGLAASMVEKLQGLLYRSVFEVIGGQLMDTEAPFMSEYYDPITVYKYKTASYSFVGPILSGATIAELDDTTTAALENYANALGVAFQLRDDDLGVFGDSSLTGKSTSQDLREGKKTKLIELFKEHANETEFAAFMASFGSHEASDDAIQALRDMLISTGARAAHDELISDYLDRSLEAITSIPEPLQSRLQAFAHQNADRKL